MFGLYHCAVRCRTPDDLDGYFYVGRLALDGIEDVCTYCGEAGWLVRVGRTEQELLGDPRDS